MMKMDFCKVKGQNFQDEIKWTNLLLGEVCNFTNYLES